MDARGGGSVFSALDWNRRTVLQIVEGSAAATAAAAWRAVSLNNGTPPLAVYGHALRDLRAKVDAAIRTDVGKRLRWRFAQLLGVLVVGPDGGETQLRAPDGTGPPPWRAGLDLTNLALERSELGREVRRRVSAEELVGLDRGVGVLTRTVLSGLYLRRLDAVVAQVTTELRRLSRYRAGSQSPCDVIHSSYVRALSPGLATRRRVAAFAYFDANALTEGLRVLIWAHGGCNDQTQDWITERIKSLSTSDGDASPQYAALFDSGEEIHRVHTHVEVSPLDWVEVGLAPDAAGPLTVRFGDVPLDLSGLGSDLLRGTAADVTQHVWLRSRTAFMEETGIHAANYLYAHMPWRVIQDIGRGGLDLGGVHVPNAALVKDTTRAVTESLRSLRPDVLAWVIKRPWNFGASFNAEVHRSVLHGVVRPAAVCMSVLLGPTAAEIHRFVGSRLKTLRGGTRQEDSLGRETVWGALYIRLTNGVSTPDVDWELAEGMYSVDWVRYLEPVMFRRVERRTPAAVLFRLGMSAYDAVAEKIHPYFSVELGRADLDVFPYGFNLRRFS